MALRRARGAPARGRGDHAQGALGAHDQLAQRGSRPRWPARRGCSSGPAGRLAPQRPAPARRCARSRWRPARPSGWPPSRPRWRTQRTAGSAQGEPLLRPAGAPARAQDARLERAVSDVRSTPEHPVHAAQVQRHGGRVGAPQRPPPRPPRWCRRRMESPPPRRSHMRSARPPPRPHRAGRTTASGAPERVAGAQPHEVGIAAPGRVRHALLRVVEHVLLPHHGLERAACRAPAARVGQASRPASSTRSPRSSPEVQLCAQQVRGRLGERHGGGVLSPPPPAHA